VKNTKFRIIDQKLNATHHLKKNFYLRTLGSFGYVCTSRDVLTNTRRFKDELRSKILSTNPSPRKESRKKMLEKELIHYLGRNWNFA
jgi:hypothetical protein